jgi:membrane protein YqaA with SNARE-associated domain
MMTGLAGLFLAAFLAATPVPMQSEVVFLAMQATGWPLLHLIIVASVANTLGSCVTYAAGRGIERFRHKSWFPLTPDRMAQATGWFNRWGLWSLLLSWAPFGDVIVAMAGVLRVPVWRFVLLVGIAKTGRYVALGLLAQGIL